MKGLPDTGASRTGGHVRYSSISSNAFGQALSQTNKAPFFIFCWIFSLDSGFDDIVVDFQLTEMDS